MNHSPWRSPRALFTPFRRVTMARKRKSAPAIEELQIPLIDVVHPMHKPFKALKKKIAANDDEASAGCLYT